MERQCRAGAASCGRRKAQARSQAHVRAQIHRRQKFCGASREKLGTQARRQDGRREDAARRNETLDGEKAARNRPARTAKSLSGAILELQARETRV